MRVRKALGCAQFRSATPTAPLPRVRKGYIDNVDVEIYVAVQEMGPETAQPSRPNSPAGLYLSIERK